MPCIAFGVLRGVQLGVRTAAMYIKATLEPRSAYFGAVVNEFCIESSSCQSPLSLGSALHRASNALKAASLTRSCHLHAHDESGPQPSQQAFTLQTSHFQHPHLTTTDTTVHAVHNCRRNAVDRAQIASSKCNDTARHLINGAWRYGRVGPRPQQASASKDGLERQAKSLVCLER